MKVLLALLRLIWGGVKDALEFLFLIVVLVYLFFPWGPFCCCLHRFW